MQSKKEFQYEDLSDKFARMNCNELLEYDSKWCKEILLNNGTTFVKSPKGSGKTHQLVTLVENAKASDMRILVIGHRKNFIEQFKNQLLLNRLINLPFEIKLVLT